MTALRRSYPLVRLMRCIHCDSTFHGDASNGYRRVRHARRPACGPSATYRAERYEDQVAALFDDAALDGSDLRRVLGAMRAQAPQPLRPDPAETERARERLQRHRTTRRSGAPRADSEHESRQPEDLVGARGLAPSRLSDLSVC